MNSKSPLVSSDLPDHRERPPNNKHDSKSPLVPSDALDHRGPPKSTNTDPELNKRSPLASIDLRAQKTKKSISK